VRRHRRREGGEEQNEKDSVGGEEALLQRGVRWQATAGVSRTLNARATRQRRAGAEAAVLRHQEGEEDVGPGPPRLADGAAAAKHPLRGPLARRSMSVSERPNDERHHQPAAPVNTSNS
jgi:hypothetical protein